MGEYIDREAVEKFIMDGLNNSDVYERFGHDAIKIIAEVHYMPAADVAPVRHGRWECNKPCPVCGEDRFKGIDADIWADWEPPYCPNCGAKMDKVSE